MMEFLQVNKVGKKVAGKAVLARISFQQQKLQKIAIAGETGSGKTTLLRVIGGLTQASEGEVLFSGLKVKGPDEVLVPGHPGIAYLSQYFELPKFLRVDQILEYAQGDVKFSKKQITTWCRIEKLLSRKTDELSGGERQRVALARQLLMAPKLLLLDEPFSNLDIHQKNLLKAVLTDVSRKMEMTSILVSHDPLDTLSWADEIMVLKAGRVVQHGEPREVYFHPLSDYVAGLFGSFNNIGKPLAKAIKSKNSILRPEQLTFSRKKVLNSVKGIVRSIRYYGSYYEVDVETQHQILIVRSAKMLAGLGDQGYVSLAK